MHLLSVTGAEEGQTSADQLGHPAFTWATCKEPMRGLLTPSEDLFCKISLFPPLFQCMVKVALSERYYNHRMLGS